MQMKGSLIESRIISPFSNKMNSAPDLSRTYRNSTPRHAGGTSASSPVSSAKRVSDSCSLFASRDPECWKDPHARAILPWD